MGSEPTRSSPDLLRYSSFLPPGLGCGRFFVVRTPPAVSSPLPPSLTALGTVPWRSGLPARISASMDAISRRLLHPLLRDIVKNGHPSPFERRLLSGLRLPAETETSQYFGSSSIP